MLVSPFAAVAAATLILLPTTIAAQSGGFVVRLGVDTVQVEQFLKSGDLTTGTVVTRAPSTAIIRYRLRLGPDGRAFEYEQTFHRADGEQVTSSTLNTRMVFRGDTVERHTLVGGAPAVQKIAAPDGVVPILGAGAVLFGNSYLTYELAAMRARRPEGASESRWYTLGASPAQMTPQARRVWLVSPDSVEMDYFGVARAGFKFDAERRLVRSDWTGTTYKYLVDRVPSIDAEAIARVWGAADRAGRGIGSVSPRDTSRVLVGGASVTVDYSRPAARGRTIWGGVVPWDTVWRLGADMATQLETDADLIIGEARVPKGKYSLFMLPGREGPLLIVNSQNGQFGTQYNAARDLVRIPLARQPLAAHAERLAIGVRDGRLTIEWGDASYTTAVRVAR